MKNYLKETATSGCSAIPFIAAWLLPIMKGDILGFAVMYFATLIFLCAVLIRLGFEMLPICLMCLLCLAISSYDSLVEWKNNIFIPCITDSLIKLLENISNKINKLIDILKSIKRR